MTTSNSRDTDYPVDPLFLDRWSPRAYDGKPMPKDDVLTILDAARWAPSSSNQQPWRFVYGLNGSAEWEDFVGLLMEGNQRWAKNSSALIVILSRTYNLRDGEKKPAATHSFDAGAAWFALAMQAHKLGYHAHGMAGIFKDKILEQMNVPEGYAVEAMIAIGKIAHKSTLPDDLAEREVPSKRLPLSQIAFEGKFTGNAD